MVHELTTEEKIELISNINEKLESHINPKTGGVDDSCLGYPYTRENAIELVRTGAGFNLLGRIDHNEYPAKLTFVKVDHGSIIDNDTSEPIDISDKEVFYFADSILDDIEEYEEDNGDDEQIEDWEEESEEDDYDLDEHDLQDDWID